MRSQEKAAPGANRAATQNTVSDLSHRSPPLVTGQCFEVHGLIRQLQPVMSFVLTADHAIPEAAARVFDLRAMGFNVQTTILPAVEFRGRIRRNVALYSLGTPEWPRPGFFDDESRKPDHDRAI